MFRKPTTVLPGITAFGLLYCLPVHGATLDAIAAGSELDGLSHVTYDARAGRLLGAIGARIVAIDPTGGKVTTVREFGSDVVALAIDATASTAAVLAGGDDALTILDLENGNVLRTTVTEAGDVDLVVHDAAADGFVVAGRLSSELTIVPSHGNPSKTVRLPGPASGAAANGRGWLFVTAADSSAVYVADSVDGTSLGQFRVPGCNDPHAPLVDDAERRLYVACRNGVLLALDSDTGVIVARSKIPKGRASIAMPAPIGRMVRIIVATQDDGLWTASGRITASSAAPVDGGDRSANEVTVGNTGTVFVVGDREIARLRQPL